MYSFVETSMFTRLVKQLMSDEEYGEMQAALIENPEAGAVIRGSGGVRKPRWTAPGRGKHGGYRIVYYIRHARGIIWMLTMYPKNVADSIPVSVLRKIREEVEDD